MSAAADVTAGRDDAWPRTSRRLPWALACLLVVLVLVPFDKVELAVDAPIDLTLDRLLLFPLLAVWFAALLTRAHLLQRLRFGALGVTVALLMAVAVASVVNEIPRLVEAEELDLAIRRTLLLASYLMFFVLVATTVRRREVPAFLMLLVGLACVAGIGTIWEFRTGTNHFYEFAALAEGPFTVEPPPANDLFDRPENVGATGHGLAATLVFSLLLPLALMRLSRTWSPKIEWRTIVWMVVTVLMLAGAVSTLRKSAGVVPVVAAVTLIALRPRHFLRLWPFGLAAVVMIQALAPSALAQIRSQLFGGDLSENTSVEGRTEDYDAVGPDIWAQPLNGRGWGTYDPDIYRYLDNQYLLLALEAGLLGVAAFLAVLAATGTRGVRIMRTRGRETDDLGAPLVASCVAFAVAAALFDVLSFPHPVYVLFFLAGLAVAATPRSSPTRVPAPWPAVELGPADRPPERVPAGALSRSA
jgi:hypothetical protein